MSAFQQQLNTYRRLIDNDIAAYTAHVKNVTPRQYGLYPGVVTSAFLDLLERGGKRIRGALTMVGYKMCGGTDMQMIVRAATAMEMIHAHFLVLDDVQDRSLVRRGQPTVHQALKQYHQAHKMTGDADHAGASLALNAVIGGGAAAQMLLAGLNVDPAYKVKVLGIVNHTIAITGHGQTLDIIAQNVPSVDADIITSIMEWKTATYTFLNPLCVGMVLAGAECGDTDAIRAYAFGAGRAFQITDDILGIFGANDKTGKTNMDDIREGKQTLLTQHALTHANPEDVTFLRTSLGDQQLTAEAFIRCQQIIERSGAKDAAAHEAQKNIQQAIEALDAAPHHWHKEQVEFLRKLATGLLRRDT